ncbi:hypothetical protein M413DRAFT_439497 [Hebeloma cylindrosporum]|uniref:Uncharacterized protein n=1 Tax=Hebeloma cylindrosporum TaxID=76867 RepID=A0A0C3CVD4_HEBCY|nr:hypothetical protein M413DRAFT_439497 [Hebeloma cylindrosporum h7]
MIGPNGASSCSWLYSNGSLGKALIPQKRTKATEIMSVCFALLKRRSSSFSKCVNSSRVHNLLDIFEEFPASGIRCAVFAVRYPEADSLWLENYLRKGHTRGDIVFRYADL